VRTHAASQELIDRLARRLHHYDVSQLLFQIAEIAGEQTYLRHGVRVGPGDTVLDVGANVGVATVFFAEACGASIVHSFEPVAPLCALLRANVAGLEGCYVHEQGLSDLPRRAEITYYPGAGAMSGLYADPERDREIVRSVMVANGVPWPEDSPSLEHRFEPQVLECELTTLSAFLAAENVERVDLLKVDVERAELDVLRGVSEPDWERIRQMAVEVHDEDGRAGSIAGDLRRRGFDVTVDQEPALRATSTRMLYAVRA
jgi:FkbM family methyltransferase